MKSPRAELTAAGRRPQQTGRVPRTTPRLRYGTTANTDRRGRRLSARRKPAACSTRSPAMSAASMRARREQTETGCAAPCSLCHNVSVFPLSQTPPAFAVPAVPRRPISLTNHDEGVFEPRRRPAITGTS
ncbi:unnamed protein product [Phaeothamnion confervicola]